MSNEVTAEGVMAGWRDGIREASPKKAKPPSAFTCTPVTRRTQYRRTEDEDAGGLDAVHLNDAGEVDLRHYERTGEVRYSPEPDLVATVAVPIIPDDLYADMPAEWLETAKAIVGRFQEPVKLPDSIPPDIARRVLACVYHMRHHNRMRLRLPDERSTDTRLPGYDLVESIKKLVRLYREEILARAGQRTMAHGVFPVYGMRNGERIIVSWRVQPWDPNKQIRNSIGEVVFGGKVHHCYAKTEEEAWNKLAEWFLKNRGLNARKYLCYRPDSAIAELAEMMRDASICANEYREVDARVLFGDDDEDGD